MLFEGKNVLVLGAGISGIAVAKVLKEQGANVTLNDAKSVETLGKKFTDLSEMGINLVLGKQDESLLHGTDYIVMSPGISIYIPLVEAAKKQEIEVLSEVEVAYRLCKAPILAVTGTNGKTTTTSLLGEIMKETGKEVVVGGNIGTALSREVLKIGSEGYVVAEISSFQLEAVSKFKPYIAAVLNVTPDHIDRHRGFENYILAKEQVFCNQDSNDILVLNYDDPIVKGMAEHAGSNVAFFSRISEVPTGAFLSNNNIVVKWKGKCVPICSVSELKLFGNHNVENVLAASLMAYATGVPSEIIARVLKSFSGVEHRIEYVETINGVAYYNDSKATNPESAIKALEAFPGNIVLIAGGRDKMTDLSLFMERIKEKVDHLILLGEASERFNQAAVQHRINHIHRVSDFEAAVKLAYSLANTPQIVLLSPACSSYDMFNNYEERGKVFKHLVRQLG